MAMTGTQTDLQSLSIQMNTAKVKHKVSYVRQWFELAILCVWKRNISISEYYKYGLYRPELPMVQKVSFVGAEKNRVLTKKLNTCSGTDFQSLFSDKLIFDLMASAYGLTPPHLQAYYATAGDAYAPILRTTSDITEFLLSQASYPVFCKPRFGSLGQGAQQIDNMNREDLKLRFSDGSYESVRAFAERVAGKFADGYLFQTAVGQRNDLVQFFGKPPVVFRVVTINSGNGAADVLYMLSRASDPGGGGVLEGSQGLYDAEIDCSSGRICSDFWKSDEYYSDGLHSDTSMKVDRNEIVIPGIDIMSNMARRFHDLFPSVRILGFDFVLSESGPVILEGNFSPYNRAIQRIRDTGIKGDRFDKRLSAMIEGA